MIVCPPSLPPPLLAPCWLHARCFTTAPRLRRSRGACIRAVKRPTGGGTAPDVREGPCAAAG